METALFLWTSSADVDVINSVPLNPPPPAPIPKARRRTTTTTKNPQRGLGVAQLERIRLHGSAASAFVDEPGSGGGVYTYHPLACRLGGAPVAYGSGCSASSVIRSALQEQEHKDLYSALDRVRTGSGGGNPLFLLPPELPSNQRGTAAAAPVCHCEYCVRKKRIFGENLGFHGAAAASHSPPAIHHHELQRKEKLVREMKEYDFFPTSSNSGDVEFGDRTAGVAYSGHGGGGDDGSSFLDLSLRL